MPTKFGLVISSIVVFIFLLLLLFGFIVRYPDVVSGQITISTSVAPIKLVAMSSGTMKLFCDSSQATVNEGSVIAYIENSVAYDSLIIIKQLLENYNPIHHDNIYILPHLPPKIALGEITSKYYNFLSALQQLYDFKNDKLYDKQIMSLQNLRQHQIKEIKNSTERLVVTKSNMEYANKFLKRDSFLYKNKVTAEAELDKTTIDYLNSKAGYASAKSNKIEAAKQAQQTQNKISEVVLQKNEKQKELEILLLASYNELMGNIRAWEQKYLFKAPFKGQVQFLKFWTNGQFIQSGEPVFTIVPSSQAPYGQVSLPAIGVGKVTVGQEVVIKLNDFPYNEYGSIKGVVNNISLTTNTERTADGNIETYLIAVQLPKGLVTNYGKSVVFKHETKGQAEIITKDRKLIERLFDNMRYVLSK